MKKAISARIDEYTLNYIKDCNINLNGLINNLLASWVNMNNIKQMNMFAVETKTDEFNQMKAKNNIKCSQCCNNCIYNNKTLCTKNAFNINTTMRRGNEFCCIYWEKKKGSN